MKSVFKQLFDIQSAIKFNQLLELCDQTFVENGNFTFTQLTLINIRQLARQAGLPKKRGVYIIYGIFEKEEEVLDIGKSGTLLQNGSFKKQSLYSRIINGKQSKNLKRIDHYKNVLKNPSLNALLVKWFVTYDQDIKIVPAQVEADLLQAYFNEFKVLPDWNKKF